MKKNFTKAMLLALTVVGMGLFNSCKDHDLCVENDVDIEILKDKNAKLDEVIKAQADKLQELADQIANIKECECTLTPEQVQQMIDDAIKNNMNSSEFTALVLDIINQMGFQTEQDVINIITKYMEEHPGLTKEQVQEMINASVEKFATKDALNSAVATLEAAIAAANDAISKTNTDVANLSQVVNDLTNVVAATMAKLDLVAADVDTLKVEVETLKAQFAETLAVWGPKLEEALITANAAKELAESNSKKIAALEESYKQLAASTAAADAALRNSLDSLANEMNKFATKEALRDVLTAAELMHAEAVAYTKRVEDWAAENLGELELKYTALETTVSEIKAKVDEIYPIVKDNKQAIDAMQGYLNKLITNIIVQRVSNPVFGSFAFPWGIESNILMGYYGETDVEVRFPTMRTANYIYKENALTEKDVEMLGESVESFNILSQSTIVDDTEGNAGKVYLTINPTNVDFEGTNFSLVNSQDTESPVKLGTITKSDETLKFGVTRAAENGFYEAPATLNPDNIPTTGVDKMMIAKNLEEVAKDVLNFKDGVNVKEAASRLFNVLVELDCDLEANAVKAVWNVGPESTQSVYSKYEVAAFAIKPLSYAFLYDINMGSAVGNKLPTLPTVDPITEAMISDILNIDKLNYELNLDLSELNFVLDDIDVEIPAFNINFAGLNLDELGKVSATVTVPCFKVVDHELVEDGDTTIVVEVETSQFKDVLKATIFKELMKTGYQIREEVRKQLEASLNKQVDNAVANIQNRVNDFIHNEFADKLSGELNDASKEALEQIKDQIMSGAGNYVNIANNHINKLNYWTGRFNGYMNRIEKELNNLNARLQVTMLYYGGDGLLHQLSNNKNYPTVFRGDGVANIIATSYTGEIIAPAVKKFVGVTNVFKGTESAQDGNVDCKAALDAVNGGESEYVNKVFSGSRYGIAVENMKKGYTYELFYSALDYSGKISARKFYVTVK